MLYACIYCVSMFVQFHLYCILVIFNIVGNKDYIVHILNGRLHNNSDGKCTCFTNNGASLVDYHISSTPLLSYISNLNVLERDESGHLSIDAQLWFISKTCTLKPTKSKHSTRLLPFPTYKWKDAYSQNKL